MVFILADLLIGGLCAAIVIANHNTCFDRRTYRIVLRITLLKC